MGNYCHSEESPNSEQQIIRKQQKGRQVYKNLIQTNRQFLDQCKDLNFQQFHKNVVERDLHSLSKYMNQKMLDISIVGSYPTEEEKQIISKNIIKDIGQKEKHLYNQLIFHYNQFLIELFELDSNQQLQTISTYNVGDLRLNALLIRNTILKRSLSDNHKFQEALVSNNNISNDSTIDSKIYRQFQENKSLASIFLDQLSCIFKLCYLILEYVYQNYIISIFGNQIDSFTDRYLLISKIYQKNIFKINPQIQQLITSALQIKYENKSSLVKSEHMSPAILKSYLIPQNSDSVLSYESGTELLTTSIDKNFKHQLQEQNIENSQKIKNFYYYQTFSTIDKIISCKMPWLKFYLIGQLDQQIVDIFLSARSQSQIAHFIDVIKPEDSKVEVLLYILQKYMSAKKNNNLSLCYYELRWMQEDDNVLHLKVKTITCPYFSRFLSLYEIAYKNYQRKQAQLLYN
ncbi:unnamed protein product [Paramecium sonneborni]|uniref:Uncharacterized protein n=1 Tax=Paramecium sonneborni TaxID=65129 RepID=A0A8S1L3C0_9CILI|nr:unnamed protein product [Paramecium sonneborni]